MKGQQLADAAEKKPPEGGTAMKEMEEMWAEAAKAFEKICGESLQQGDVRGFDDVQKKIEAAGEASYGLDAGPEDKWEKAKSVGLKSLKYLKLLVGAASQASMFIPIPGSVANIASTALCFVFDIPEAIKGYNDAIDKVFSEVSSALSQFQIYTSMENVKPELIHEIHLVMVSFVKICAHVVKYRQGRRRDRFLRQIKSIFDEDSGLGDEMAEFKRVQQRQRDAEGTITLAVVVETRHDLAMLLEQSIHFGKMTEETHEAVQETQKGVQALKDDADRVKTLIKIREALSVPATVRVDANTFYEKCLPGTGSWIWMHDAYIAWTTRNKDKDASHVLLVSGPPSSGKTSVSALVTKRLEDPKGRVYVAHYFFPPSAKKSDDKNPVQSALKYMAFQIARADVTTQQALDKACDAGTSTFHNLTSLETLWEELKIGTSGSGAVYYLMFDGLENLPPTQAEMLLTFIFDSKLARESAARVRVLVTGMNDQFTSRLGVIGSSSVLRIRMEENNVPDMRIVIKNELTERGILQHAKPDSNQQRARDKIIEKLPQNVSGSYSLLKLGLDNVIRLLSMRTAVQELDRILDQPMSGREEAIKNLQRSLTADEIKELNELLRWALFSSVHLTLDQLEAALFLYSGTESLTSLQYIIENKYSVVLELDDGGVYVQDGVKDYLQKENDTPGKSSHSKDRATISMTISINNVDQELCGNFLWDLTHKAIRDNFKFDFDATSPNNALHSSSHAAIAVDEFEAHHTIVTRAFQYLGDEHRDETREIGEYLVCWLPYHLRELEDEDKGALMPGEQFEIGQNLYRLFKDEQVFRRHRASFEQTWWLVDEMEVVRKWLMDSAVMRRLDKNWRDEVQLAVSPTRGFLKELVKMVIEGFLRERSWGVQNAYCWITEFMEADDKKPQQPSDEIDWDHVSAWCQDFLGLPESELNSLWYERLSEASSLQGSKVDTVLSLYQRAIEKENPSWVCHRMFGTILFSQGRTQEAVAQVELALNEAEREGAIPKPEAKDIVELHLLLEQYAYEAGDVRKAEEHYLFTRESKDAEQATLGLLVHLKARLNFPDAEGKQQLLKSTLAMEGGERRMVDVLKMIAQDTDHDVLVSKMFTVAKGDPDLLKGIVRTMETATNEDCTAEPEARGVLLYDCGVAAYMYKVSPDGTEAVGEALRLWEESRSLLSKMDERNALMTYQDVTMALAQHYFQSMADSDIYRSDSAGFVGTLHALRGEKGQARAALVQQIRLGLQILSDDTPDNDRYGLVIIHNTLWQYQDFKNAAVALSLVGQPDLVTEALYFEANDIVGNDGMNKERMLDIVTKLAEETVQVAKTQVPDISQQIQRIKAARVHVDSLMAAAETKPKPEAEGSDGQGKEGEPTVPDLETASVYSLLHSRLSALQETHTPKINTEVFWACDGCASDSKHCETEASFEREFYHCVYCSNRDFCGDCLARLRAPDSNAQIMTCSAKHRWLRMPPWGRDIYVGLRAKSAWVPKEVRTVEGDESILEICYGENGCREEIMVEAWKEVLAREWDISLEEIKDMSRQATSDEGEHEGEQGEEEEEEDDEQMGGEKSEVNRS